MAKNIGLGRGLGALMEMDSLGVSGTSSINEVELSLILPNPHQPRSHFDEESLAELASSIKELGVISPITLRKNEDNTYMIIAGERRYRAAKSLELALLENLQREDLNAIEIALTFFRLIQEYKLTQERLSERVGKKRATIANYLRLLHLPAEIQMGLKNRKIDMGHARAILGIAEPAVQLKLYNLILKNNYPVRMIEEMVRNYAETGNLSGKQPALRQPKLNDLKELGDLKNQLSQIFNTKVQLTCDEKGKGKITIPFADDEQLMKIMQLIDRI